MTDRIKIEITATDGASKVFDAIVDSAEEMIPAIDGATNAAKKLGPAADDAVDAIKPLDKELEEAGKAAKEAGTNIERSARSLGDYKDAADKTQQGLALLATSFTLYANQAREHEITVQALERLYGSAADSYIAFANQIQNTSIFSNDEALEAARIMGTLRENYDLTDQQIQQLIQTSADLATMHGFTLSDAAQRVSAAIRGEAESAEMLGLTMNQAAIDADGLTLSMTNAEAAAFRYDALMVQAASSTGAAAEAAETTTGKIQQLANRTQDAALGFVDLTGPIGQAAAALGTFGVEAGIAVAGLGRLGQGLAALRGTAGLASIAAFAPALIGPVGVVAGLGLAAYGVYEFYNALTASEPQITSSQLANEALAASYTKVGESAADAATLANAQTFQLQVTSGFEQIETELAHFQSLWDEVGQFLGGNAPMMYQAQVLQLEEYIASFGSSAEEAGYKIQNMRFDLADIISSGNVQAIREAAAAWEKFQASDQTLADFQELHDTINEIDHSLADYEYQANLAADSSVNLAETSNQATSATESQTEAVKAATDAYTDYELARAQTVVTTQEELALIERRRLIFVAQTSALDGAALAWEGLDLTLQQVEKTYADLFPEIDQTTRAATTLDDTFWQLTGTMKDEIAVSIAETEARFIAAQDAASGLSDTMLALQGMGGSARFDLAVNTGNAQSALQSGFGAIVGGTNQMGQLSQQTADWAASLTDANTGMSQLDNLLLDGAISSKTYRDALEANHRIQEANVEVQEDVLRIQAKQLPVMAELAEEQARYVDQIADMPADQQTVALGYLDQTKAAEALSIAQYAAVAAQAGMTESASAMILEMAKADPILKAMLIDMGLLSETEGELTVNFDDVPSAAESLAALNTTLERFIVIIGDAFNIDVNLDDGGAASTITAISNQLTNLDGRTATVYINTLGGNTVGFTDDFRNGGVVGYANGGMVLAELSEDGPELVRLANGGVAMAPTRGLYMVEPGSNVMPAEASKAEMQRRRGSGSGTTNYYGSVTQNIRQDVSAFAIRRSAIAGARR